jgi:hypothetical protein
MIKPTIIRVRDIFVALNFRCFFLVHLRRFVAGVSGRWTATRPNAQEPRRHAGLSSSGRRSAPVAGAVLGHYLELTSLAQVPDGRQAREKVVAARSAAGTFGLRALGSGPGRITVTVHYFLVAHRPPDFDIGGARQCKSN